MRVNAAKATRAAEVLDLDIDQLTEASVGAAYRTAAKECHPDSSNHDPARWQAISTAKDTLLEWLALRAKARRADISLAAAPGNCRACAGLGWIQQRRGFTVGARMRCVLCEGTGNSKKHDREQ